MIRLLLGRLAVQILAFYDALNHHAPSVLFFRSWPLSELQLGLGGKEIDLAVAVANAVLWQVRMGPVNELIQGVKKTLIVGVWVYFFHNHPPLSRLGDMVGYASS